MPYVIATNLRKCLYIVSWIPRALLTLIFLIIAVPYSFYTRTPIMGGRLDASSRARIRREKEQPKPLLQPPGWYQPWSWYQLRYHPVSLSFDPARNAQSPLLTLPAELRNHVYTAVLGGSIVHLDSSPLFPETREEFSGRKIIPRKRVTHTRCTCVGGQYCKCFGWHAVFQGIQIEHETWGYDPHRASTERIGIALLQTCRQIHAEAIRILYGTNTFNVRDLWDFIDFSRAILPGRLAMVTQLDVKWLYYDCVTPLDSTSFWGSPERKRQPYDDQTWKEFWDVVSTTMPGLLDLKASLDVRIYNDHLSTEAWIEPLLKVHGLRSCGIELRDRDNGLWDKSEGPWKRPREVIRLEERLEDHMCDRAAFKFQG